MAKKKDAQPSKTSLVLKALEAADDFVTAAQLVKTMAAIANPNQISAALHHLKNRHAVDCMESDGSLWWYTTPDLDDRTKTVDERVVEENPRRRRGSPVIVDEARPRAVVKSTTKRFKTEAQEANEIAARIRKKN